MCKSIVESEGNVMPKVDIVDCVKQIIAINKELDDHDSRQDGFVYFLEQLNTRIERLEQRANAEHYGKGVQK